MTTERKIKQSLCKRHLVVAIDFGTTYSGFAFSFRNEPFCLKTSETWNAPSSGLQSWKTPTVLLLNERKEFVAFGYQAEELYEQYIADETHGNYYYCRRFKMSLHTSVIMDINYKIKDFNGKDVEALLVFRESIKYLMKEAEDLINKRGYLNDVEKAEFKKFGVEWVLTVPAMWTDAAKQFMRKAAEEAGIKDENLKMALEPEAASILFMHLDCITTNTTDNQDRGFKCGAKYLVVDMGGGTVDITLHRVVDETSLEELVPPCGGHWGGTTVDKNYVRFLEGIFGTDVFKRFAKEDPGSLVDLYRVFEIKKRAFFLGCESQDNTNKKTIISVPHTLVKTMKEMYPAKDIENVIEKDDILRGKVTWKKDKLIITSDLFASFFETCLKGTINEIEGVIRNFADVEAILLVGGCAESPLIHKKVKSRFPDKRVIVPEDAGLAVVKGAVLYGHFPNIIVSRVARHSYGIRVFRDFNPDQHPEDKLVVIGTKRKCKDVFAVHVKKGQKLRVGEVQSSKRYTRLERDQASLIFDFYASTSENPEYVTDDCCEEIGQLEVELNPCSKGVTVSLKYGGTELEAEGYDEVTRKRTKVTFKFIEKKVQR